MITNEKQVKNIHAGHRQRLRKQIDSAGLYNLSDLHFLEYLLTFVIKRSDTNPIAHGLLNKFGSIDKIFNAPLNQLTKVKGVGQKTAEFLQYMSAVIYMYKKDIYDDGHRLGTVGNIIKFAEMVLPESEKEQLLIIVLNKNYTVKDYIIFDEFYKSFAGDYNSEIVEFLINHKANFIIFAHTHPHVSAQPSLWDLEEFHEIQKIAKALSIVVYENIVIGKKDIFSLKSKALYDRMKET